MPGPGVSVSPAQAALVQEPVLEPLPTDVLNTIAALTLFPRDLSRLAPLAGRQEWPGLRDRSWASRARRSCLG